MTTTSGVAADQEFIGHGPAGAHVGVSANTLSSCVSAGTGPDIARWTYVGQYRRPVYLASELERWIKSRPGKGARTDRMHAGGGLPCHLCSGACKIGD